VKLPLDVEECVGMWITGESGSGKSYYARTAEKRENIYLKMMNKWWDGYRDEPVVILDDMAPDHNYIAYYLKIWLDRYAYMGEVKGGVMAMRPSKIIITSQYTIEEVFKEERDAIAIRRRCKVVEWNLQKRRLGLSLAAAAAEGIPDLPELDTAIIME